MKSKQELIDLAFDEAGLTKMKGFHPKEDGWCIVDPKSPTVLQQLELLDVKEEYCTDIRPNDSRRSVCRPKSLRGLYYNNGWTKVDKENFPKQGVPCEFVANGEHYFVGCVDFTGDNYDVFFYDYGRKCLNSWMPEQITHFRLLKPNLPLH
jgi:hypothetical protein